LVVFIEGLEDKTPEIRAGACEALGKLEVGSALYLSKISIDVTGLHAILRILFSGFFFHLWYHLYTFCRHLKALTDCPTFVKQTPQL
jgi:hypothetical protein